MARKRDEPRFNNPFIAAKSRLSEVVAAPREREREAAEARRAEAARVAEAAREAERARSEERLFADEMAGVDRMAPDPRGRAFAPASRTAPLVSRRAADEAEAYAELADLIEGSGPFDLSDTDEHLEGIAPGLDRRLLRKLRRGDYALQGHVDLHGMTRDEARLAVERFIDASRAAGRRCVLIVHGRGLHSKDAIPVLKERVRAWLERGRVSRSVLAFASALPADGGTGAVYVLLRR